MIWSNLNGCNTTVNSDVIKGYTNKYTFWKILLDICCVILVFSTFTARANICQTWTSINQMLCVQPVFMYHNCATSFVLNPRVEWGKATKKKILKWEGECRNFGEGHMWRIPPRVDRSAIDVCNRAHRQKQENTVSNINREMIQHKKNTLTMLKQDGSFHKTFKLYLQLIVHFHIVLRCVYCDCQMIHYIFCIDECVTNSYH